MKQLWQRILNIFHPKIVEPLNDWQKQVFEELDSLSPSDEKYWRVLPLLSDEAEAEMYFLRKKYPRVAETIQKPQSFSDGKPVISENYKRPLHENPYYKKRPW